jgi:broad specificity phosphatase PhoE
VHQTLAGLAQHAKPNAPAVAFTSAGFISTALGMMQGHSPAEIRANIMQIPNASITTLDQEPGTQKWHVVQPPSDGFLPEAMRTQI